VTFFSTDPKDKIHRSTDYDSLENRHVYWVFRAVGVPDLALIRPASVRVAPFLLAPFEFQPDC
jgi:hypothetical protein